MPGTHESFHEVNNGLPVDVQWIRYDPQKPDPAVKSGGASLRVEAYGCVKGNKRENSYIQNAKKF